MISTSSDEGMLSLDRHLAQLFDAKVITASEARAHMRFGLSSLMPVPG